MEGEKFRGGGGADLLYAGESVPVLSSVALQSLHHGTRQLQDRMLGHAGLGAVPVRGHVRVCVRECQNTECRFSLKRATESNSSLT